MSAETSTRDTPRCPTEWREATLSSVSDIRFSSVDKLTKTSEEPVRLCNYTDVYSNDYITDDIEFMQATATQAEIERFGLQPGDIIITKDSETPDDIGIPAMIDTAGDNLVCGYHLALIRPKRDEVDSVFLSKQLSHYRISRYFGQQSNGLTRYGLPTGAVANTPLWLPELEKQETIGAVLRLMDAAIAKTEAVIAKLKHVRAGLLHDLLTRGLDEHGKLRDPIAHPEQFKDSPLGRIPREWEVSSLGDLCRRIGGSIQTGPFGSQLHSSDYQDTGIPIITVEHLGDGTISHDNLPLVGASDYQRLLKYQLHVGDLVFSRVGAIDRCGLVTEHEHGWLFSGRCLRVRLNSEKSDSHYYAYQLNSHRCRRWILNNAVGSTMHCLNTQILESLPVISFDYTEQKRISDVVSVKDDQIAKEALFLEKLRKLKSGLMADLLTGRVRVPETLFTEGAL